MSDELQKLVDRLNNSPCLSESAASALHKKAFEAAYSRMEDGQTYGQAMGGLEILNQPEEQFRAELKSIDNDLGRQIEIVNEAFDGWFAKGETPPPYYAWRIAIILGKSERKEEERAFLAAWCKHFGNTRGARYEALAKRARKCGAI